MGLSVVISARYVRFTPQRRLHATSAGPMPGRLGTSRTVNDTATNTVVATVGVGLNPDGVAVTPEWKNANVTNG